MAVCNTFEQLKKALNYAATNSPFYRQLFADHQISVDDIQSMEDLEGKHTANTISSTYAETAEAYGAEVTGVDDLNQTFELLLSGRIDATLNSEVTYYDYMKAHPDADIKIAVLADDASEVGIPFRKGEETASLREAVNGILDEMRESGELSQLSEKYFGTDISSASAN